mgnify:CR=1 FL=1
MVELRLKVDTAGKGEQLKLRFNNPRPVLRAIGAMVDSDSQSSFRNQKLGPVAWPPRAVPNIAGIVGDLNVGRRPPSRRFQARPALIDTGSPFPKIL